MAELSKKQKAKSKKQVELVPTITQSTMQQYQQLLDQVKPFAKRIHFDFSDGIFTPNRTPNLIQAHWPDKVQANLHLMYEQPTNHLETAISLKPRLVIIHAEAKGELASFMNKLKEAGILVGVAFLQETSV